MKEIERKFLVISNDWRNYPATLTNIKQGYISKNKLQTVRVRIANNQGFLTIKGKKQGFTRDEFEYSIPLDDAQYLISKLCIKDKIIKDRHTFLDEFGQRWEVDVFRGKNLGLIVAEIELMSEDQLIKFPTWVGQEVTKDSKFSNLYLASHTVTVPKIK